MTATQEDIFSQPAVLVDLTKKKICYETKFKSKRFSKGFYLSFDVRQVVVKNCLYFL